MDFRESEGKYTYNLISLSTKNGILIAGAKVIRSAHNIGDLQLHKDRVEIKWKIKTFEILLLNHTTD